MDDHNAQKHYSDPEQVRGGKRVTPSIRPAMKGHVPIRFPEGVVEQVRVLAQRDGVTVSTWIRRLVMQELERRMAPQTSATYKPDWVTAPPAEHVTMPDPDVYLSRV